MTHRITLIPGDGTGPEIAEATRRVLEATGVPIEWDVQHAGIDVMEKAGTPLPDLECQTKTNAPHLLLFCEALVRKLWHGTPGRIRTCDPRFRKPLLCPI